MSGDKFDRLYPHERQLKAMRDAAPDLYEALERIANHFDMTDYGADAWKALPLEMAEIAGAALSKARGTITSPIDARIEGEER